MGMRVRPIRELGPEKDDGKEEVRCWRCQTQFLVSRTMTRATCPECKGLVALHRLKMPMMPSRKSKEEVIRLHEEVEIHEKRQDPIPLKRSGESRKRMTPFGNREMSDWLDAGEPDLASPERLRFEARGRIEERRRKLFEEAEPRMEGVEEGPKMGSLSRRMLVVSLVVLGTLVLWAVGFALRGG